MTSSTSSDSTPSPPIDDRISFLCGQWLPHCQLSVSVDDPGFRQGVVAVERLRTYGRQVFTAGEHLDRWHSTTAILSIQGLPSLSETESLIAELLERNKAWVSARGDVGITLFATPGDMPAAKQVDTQRAVTVGPHPTFGLHLNPLDQARIQRHRDHGQPLVITDVVQPDSASWPRAIKTRSRIHYYLADRAAKQKHPDAVGVLLDNDSTVTETSIANLAIVRSGEIFSPPSDRVLGGITQSVVESLASQQSIGWSKMPISVSELTQADEVLMMGTDGGIWFANSVDGVPVADGKAGSTFVDLRQRFDQWVAFADQTGTTLK